MSKKTVNDIDELDGDELAKLTSAYILGRELPFQGPGVDSYVKELEADVKFAKANGYTLDIPSDIQV